MFTAKYFEGCHPRLECRLEDHFDRMRGMFSRMRLRGALVLGGGYGRGEGGVMLDGGEPSFSNDLDYFLFDDAPDDPSLRAWCRDVEREESKALGIDVEIKCLRPDSIRKPVESMMFADLVAGHVVVAGDAGFLAAMKDGLDFSRIRSEEAARLLWNRGSGMFYSRCRMGREGELGFVIRNHAKLKLALGDAWLCLEGRYTPKCRERGRHLMDAKPPAGVPKLREWHEEGVEFKFHPFSRGVEWKDLETEARELIGAWGEIYLAVEEARLGKRFDSFADYLTTPRLIRSSSFPRNLALACRDKIKRGGCLRPLGDYPRAGLMRALPCLLGLTPGGVAEAGCFLPGAPEKPSKPESWEPIYSKWWSCYA